MEVPPLIFKVAFGQALGCRKTFCETELETDQILSIMKSRTEDNENGANTPHPLKPFSPSVSIWPLERRRFVITYIWYKEKKLHGYRRLLIGL